MHCYRYRQLTHKNLEASEFSSLRKSTRRKSLVISTWDFPLTLCKYFFSLVVRYVRLKQGWLKQYTFKHLQGTFYEVKQAHSIENETFCSKLNLDLDISVHVFVICNNQTFHNRQNFSLIPLVFLCMHKLKYMNILCTNYQFSPVFFKHRWYTWSNNCFQNKLLLVNIYVPFWQIATYRMVTSKLC